MKVKLFGCKKFRRLSYERLDRELTVSEESFLNRHSEVCSECVRATDQGFVALGMLREGIFPDSVLASNPRAGFDERVMRAWRVDKGRSNFRYWSPAFIGAAVAGVVLLGAIQMIAQSSRLPKIGVPAAGAAMRYSSTEMPDLSSHPKNVAIPR